MEIWDVYDGNFHKVPGMSLVRGEPIPEGCFHLVCEIIVRHEDGTYLLMQRDKKKHFGGMWEASAGGSALQGETPLECAVRELRGLFNHAALLEDGSVWTWGYNYAGGCGVPEFGIVDTPTKVAEHVIKVWTCKKRTNTCADYENMSPINEKQMENTIIEKLDHSFFSCGEGVGNEERILKKYYEAVDFPMICTHEFLPCAPMNP